MRQGTWLLNLVLLALVALLVHRVLVGWEDFERSTEQEIYEQFLSKGSVVSEKDSFVPEEVRSAIDFLVVAERNLFTPERRMETAAPVVAAAPQPPPLTVRPVLDGVSTMKGRRQAFMTVFEGKQNQGKSRVVVVGDPVQGYTVGEITNSTVKLVWNNHVEVIDIMDSNKAQQASAASAASASAVTVVTVGSARAAVETTTSSGESGEEKTGLRVSSVGGNQRGVRAGGMGMGMGGQGMGMGGQGMGMGGQGMGMGGQGMGMGRQGMGRGRQGVGGGGYGGLSTGTVGIGGMGRR